MIIHFLDLSGAPIAPVFSDGADPLDVTDNWPTSYTEIVSAPFGSLSVARDASSPYNPYYYLTLSLAPSVSLSRFSSRRFWRSVAQDGSAPISQYEALSDTPVSQILPLLDGSQIFANNIFSGNPLDPQTGDQIRDTECFFYFDGIPESDGGSDGTTPRHDSPADAPLAFFRIRSSVSTRFFPGAGSRLAFASLATDSLDIPFARHAFLQHGDRVRVTFFGTSVFCGSVESIRHHKGRGDDEYDAVSVKGPWAKLARLVYLQQVATGALTHQKTSRLILNQAADGSEQSVNASLAEILDFAATKCGFSAGSVAVSSTLHLPFDECRDITCADAVRKVLKFFPKVLSRFDYSSSSPALSLFKPDLSQDVGDYSRSLSIDTTSTDHPVERVDLEIESVSSSGYRSISHQRYPEISSSYDDTAVNTLYATLSLAAAESSSVSQSFTAKGEAIGSFTSVSWWLARHPRLNGIPASAISISDATRTLHGDVSASDYPYISANSAPEIASAGLKSVVGTFSCKATITTSTDVESDIFLTLDYLLTNAIPNRTYTWTVSSTSSSGESVPANLAKAIFEDRSSPIASQDISIALASRFPQIGDSHDGIPLQSFEIDCASLVASLHFGRPAHLSPDDMAAVLSGFRNRKRCTSFTSRTSGKPSDDNPPIAAASVPPLSTSEWQPGTKSKLTIKGDTSAGSISLDSSSVSAGSTIAPHTLTVGSGSSATSIQVLASADASISDGSGVDISALNNLNIITSIAAPSSSNNYNITATRKIIKVANNTVSIASTANQTIPTTPLSSS